MILNLQNIVDVYEKSPNVSLHMSKTSRHSHPKRGSPKAILARCTPTNKVPLTLVPLYEVKNYAREKRHLDFSIGTGTLYAVYGHTSAKRNGTLFGISSPNVDLEIADGWVEVLRNDRGEVTGSTASDCVKAIKNMIRVHDGVSECQYKLLYHHCINVTVGDDHDFDLVVERTKAAIKETSNKHVEVSASTVAKNVYSISVYDPIDCECDYLAVDFNRLKLTLNATHVDYHISFNNNGGDVAATLHTNYCKRLCIEFNESQYVYEVFKFFGKETEGYWYGIHDKSKPVVT